MKLKFVFFMIVLVVSLAGCRAFRQPVSTIETKDSVVYTTVIDTFLIPMSTEADSLNLVSLLVCDSLNNVHMITIDTLKSKLSAKMSVKNNKLYTSIKKLPETYYKQYIREKTAKEQYMKTIKNEIVYVNVPEPMNKRLLLAVIVLTGFLLLIIFVSKK